jgi:hypothetical protein
MKDFVKHALHPTYYQLCYYIIHINDKSCSHWLAGIPVRSICENKCDIRTNVVNGIGVNQYYPYP